MDSIKLSNGVLMPRIGFGVFQAKDGMQTENAVLWALQDGYRHIDTAMIYYNEASVGSAIKKSELKREEIFLTTKLWNEDMRQGKYRQAFEMSLELLGVDYLDLYLLHWPTDGFVEAWLGLEELYLEGKIKAIGVSNFQIHHLETLAKHSKITPMVNQIESNVMFANQELIDYCISKGIVVQVWSPLGGNNTTQLTNETLISIASAHNKSVAQIIIRWHLQRGIVPLPKSVNEGRIKENFNVFDFELSKQEMDAINGLNQNCRVGADPDNFDF